MTKWIPEENWIKDLKERLERFKSPLSLSSTQKKREKNTYLTSSSSNGMLPMRTVGKINGVYNKKNCTKILSFLWYLPWLLTTHHNHAHASLSLSLPISLMHTNVIYMFLTNNSTLWSPYLYHPTTILGAATRVVLFIFLIDIGII